MSRARRREREAASQADTQLAPRGMAEAILGRGTMSPAAGAILGRIGGGGLGASPYRGGHYAVGQPTAYRRFGDYR